MNRIVTAAVIAACLAVSIADAAEVSPYEQCARRALMRFDDGRSDASTVANAIYAVCERERPDPVRERDLSVLTRYVLAYRSMNAPTR